MNVLKRDIPPRGALAVIALVLIGSFVGGREQPAGATALTHSSQAGEARPAHTDLARAAQATQRPAQEETLSDLDLTKLRRERWSEGVANLLAPRSAPPPPAQAAALAAPSAAPPAPVAPPLPFAYLGKIVDGARTTVFIGRGPDHYSVEAGTEIDQYKVEKVSETQITFVYRPLGTRQVLAVPQPGQEPTAR
jgi:hypothetical protein